MCSASMYGQKARFFYACGMSARHGVQTHSINILKAHEIVHVLEYFEIIMYGRNAMIMLIMHCGIQSTGQA